jgi:hypothetical protein
MRIPQNGFFLSVALADLMVASVNTSFSGLFNIVWYWPFAGWMCRLAGFGEVTPNLAAVFPFFAFF